MMFIQHHEEKWTFHQLLRIIDRHLQMHIIRLHSMDLQFMVHPARESGTASAKAT